MTKPNGPTNEHYIPTWLTDRWRTENSDPKKKRGMVGFYDLGVEPVCYKEIPIRSVNDVENGMAENGPLHSYRKLGEEPLGNKLDVEFTKWENRAKKVLEERVDCLSHPGGWLGVPLSDAECVSLVMFLQGLKVRQPEQARPFVEAFFDTHRGIEKGEIATIKAEDGRFGFNGILYDFTSTGESLLLGHRSVIYLNNLDRLGGELYLMPTEPTKLLLVVGRSEGLWERVCSSLSVLPPKVLTVSVNEMILEANQKAERLKRVYYKDDKDHDGFIKDWVKNGNNSMSPSYDSPVGRISKA